MSHDLNPSPGPSGVWEKHFPLILFHSASGKSPLLPRASKISVLLLWRARWTLSFCQALYLHCISNSTCRWGQAASKLGSSSSGSNSAPLGFDGGGRVLNVFTANYQTKRNDHQIILFHLKGLCQSNLSYFDRPRNYFLIEGNLKIVVY